MILLGSIDVSWDINETKPELCFLNISASDKFISLLIISFKTYESIIGFRWFSLFGSNFSLSEHRWMARLGIFSSGVEDLQSLDVNFPYY